QSLPYPFLNRSEIPSWRKQESSLECPWLVPLYERHCPAAGNSPAHCYKEIAWYLIAYSLNCHRILSSLLQLDSLILQAGTLLAAAIAFLVGLFILWVIVSVPVYLAAKILTLGKAKFTRAMLVTALGPIVVAIVYLVFAFVLSATIGSRTIATAIAFIIAFVAWIGVFKKGFDTGWLRAFGIAVLATV